MLADRRFARICGNIYIIYTVLRLSRVTMTSIDSLNASFFMWSPNYKPQLLQLDGNQSGLSNEGKSRY